VAVLVAQLVVFLMAVMLQPSMDTPHFRVVLEQLVVWVQMVIFLRNQFL
jgi:hypothetical protein